VAGWLKKQKIVICGMARNIAGILPVTFRRLEQICQQFGDYGIVIVENDSEDETKAVLEAYRDADPRSCDRGLPRSWLAAPARL
jgi:glycosyltransferase involved in cell wall biosynthesis